MRSMVQAPKSLHRACSRWMWPVVYSLAIGYGFASAANPGGLGGTVGAGNAAGKPCNANTTGTTICTSTPSAPVRCVSSRSSCVTTGNSVIECQDLQGNPSANCQAVSVHGPKWMISVYKLVPLALYVMG